MEVDKTTSSHKPPSDSGMAKEEFIRVGTTLYYIVEQPRLSGGYVKKRIPWNNETLRQDYGKDYISSAPKYNGFCTVLKHIGRSWQPKSFLCNEDNPKSRQAKSIWSVMTLSSRSSVPSLNA